MGETVINPYQTIKQAAIKQQDASKAKQESKPKQAASKEKSQIT
jgi:hypothetical protein